MQDQDSGSTKTSTSAPQRKISQSTTGRHLSLSGSKPMNIVPSTSSAQFDTSRDGHEQPGSRTVRQRLTSMVQRGADLASNLTSPLAQIYQPLVVDDDIMENNQDPDAQPSISYGPAMRRRLSSMHKFPPLSPADNERKMNFPRTQGGQVLDDSLVQESPRSREDLMETNGQASRGLTSPLPGPVSSIVEGEKPASLDLSVNLIMERMTNLEESQKRLEELIMQLSKDLKSHKE